MTHRVETKHLSADALSRRPCRSCERQEQRNLLSDSDEDTNEVTPEISVCAVTRSEAAKDTISPESGKVRDGWQLESVRQAQLDDKDIALLLVAKESNENRPARDKVSHGSGTMITILRLWDRLKSYMVYSTVDFVMTMVN